MHVILVLPSYLEEKEDYMPSDTTKNVSLDVRGHFYAGWDSCPYRQKNANLALPTYSRVLGKRK